jgi:hypothetical protein
LGLRVAHCRAPWGDWLAIILRIWGGKKTMIADLSAAWALDFAVVKSDVTKQMKSGVAVFPVKWWLGFKCI